MSRYTGPSWKLSRRLGISLSETGKELARRTTHQVNTATNVRKSLSMVCNYKKNKNYATLTA